MRNNILAAAAALTAVISWSAPVEAAPKRKPAASAAAKKKAAAAAAASARAAEARAAAEAAEQARLRPAWGLLAELGNRDLEMNGAPVLLRWEQPMRTLRVTTVGAKGNDEFVFTLDAQALKLSGRSLTGKDPKTIDFFVAPTGEIMWSALGKPERFMWREKDGSIRQRWSAGSTRAWKPLDPDGRAGITLAALVASGKVARLPQAGQFAMARHLFTKEEAMAFFRSLQGSWSNGEAIVTFRPSGEAVVTNRVWSNGNASSDGAIRLENGQLMYEDQALVFAPGGFFLPLGRWGFFPKPDGSYDIRLVRLSGGAMVPNKDKNSSIHGSWARVTGEQELAFRKRAEQTRLANIQAEQQRQSSGGGGMFGRMLAGAALGAMMGGNSSQSLEMAVAGATQAAQGGNALDTMNAIGGIASRDAAESKRQLDNTIAQIQYQEAMKRAAAEGTTSRQSGSASSGGAIVVASAPPPVAPPKAAPVKVAQAPTPVPTIYYSCMGTVRGRQGDRDVTKKIYYGIITSRGYNPDRSEALFRQHTGSGGFANTEQVGTSCAPNDSRAQAQSRVNGLIQRDSRGPWEQITGIELSL